MAFIPKGNPLANICVKFDELHNERLDCVQVELQGKKHDDTAAVTFIVELGNVHATLLTVVQKLVGEQLY